MKTKPCVRILFLLTAIVTAALGNAPAVREHYGQERYSVV